MNDQLKDALNAAPGHPYGQGLAGNTPAHVRAMELPAFKRCLRRSGMSPDSFVHALTQTALSGLTVWTLADLETLLLVCERHGLDPLGREVYLHRQADPLTQPALVVVGVDGWCRILNNHPSYAGVQFKESAELLDGVPAWAECTLHRWDRRVPTRVREYLVEVRGTSQAWHTHPRRMLRHKALVQCARLAFGLVGIYDHDEAPRVLAGRGEDQVRRLNRGGPVKPLKRGMGVSELKSHLQSLGGASA